MDDSQSLAFSPPKETIDPLLIASSITVIPAATHLNYGNQLLSINTTTLAPIKLSPTNYYSWQTQWDSLFIGYAFEFYIETPPFSQPNITFLKRQDRLLHSAFFSTSSTDLVPFVISAKTPYNVWHTLKKYIWQSKSCTLYELRGESCQGHQRQSINHCLCSEYSPNS
ncbi:hypothetical protein CDL12_19733 [Handroanthus impetiginosus]|uniref:Uncharacterized protein n=1 Tax=Handroanthus impetiginosus TaxID=429701 RepID=A0A2G9GQW4_9LAMI|nr:hypothetical protein CDL12_19733 [Handroanthus impetiginosus]